MAVDLRVINWLASYPKSGNTWVRFLWQIYRTGCDDINANLKLTLSDAMISPHQQVSSFALEDLSRDSKILLRHGALLYLVGQMGSPPMIVKTHSANITVNSVGLIPGELTKSSTYLIRDPRSVAVSMSKHFDCPVDDAITMMDDEGGMLGSDKDPVQFISSWSKHVTSWEGRDGIILRYEDLRDNPEFCFAAIVKHWGVDPEPNLVKEAVEKSSFENFKTQEETRGFIEQGKSTFFNNSDWTKVLTDKQVNRIETSHGDLMRKYKYL